VVRAPRIAGDDSPHADRVLNTPCTPQKQPPAARPLQRTGGFLSIDQGRRNCTAFSARAVDSDAALSTPPRRQPGSTEAFCESVVKSRQAIIVLRSLVRRDGGHRIDRFRCGLIERAVTAKETVDSSVQLPPKRRHSVDEAGRATGKRPNTDVAPAASPQPASRIACAPSAPMGVELLPLAHV
jgi:hypothetical protein